MDLELVTIGTELLLGHTIDTNGAEIARRLAVLGVRVVRRTSVADDPAAIRDAVAAGLARTRAVLTTGGLGPTRDDITKQVVAELYDWPLAFDDTVWAAVLERYRRFGRTPVESNRSQAEVPEGAIVLLNRWGTAPGLWLEGTPGLAIMLPGVPLEMRMLLEHEVEPRLAARGGGAVIRSRTVRTTGIPESTLAERLGEIEAAIGPATLAYLPGVEGVDLRVTAWNQPADAVDVRLAAAVAELRARAGEFVYGEDADDLSRAVVDRARAAHCRLAVAESCTGGLLGARLTDTPGSSAVMIGGVIAYDNAVKTGLLSVPSTMIETCGAVSEETAGAMAEGVRRLLTADLAISLTGIAGPDGGSADKPVGTVCFGLASARGTETRRAVFGGSRSEIRARAAQAALWQLYRALPAGDE